MRTSNSHFPTGIDHITVILGSISSKNLSYHSLNKTKQKSYTAQAFDPFTPNQHAHLEYHKITHHYIFNRIKLPTSNESIQPKNNSAQGSNKSKCLSAYKRKTKNIHYATKCKHHCSCRAKINILLEQSNSKEHTKIPTYSIYITNLYKINTL